MALAAATLATAAPSASDQHLLELYSAELIDLRLGGTYDCDPPGEDSVYSDAIARMRRIKPLLTQRAGADALAVARADAERGYAETIETVSLAGCKIGDKAFDRKNLTAIRNRHENRLRALEKGLGLKSRKDR